MRIGKNVEMLEIAGPMSVYPTLLWDEKNLVLVDTGIPGMWGAICAAITKAGQRPEDITALILTHQDMDHIGCVKDVLAASPDVKIYAHADEVPYISGQKEPQKLESIKKRFDLSTDAGRAGFEQFRQGFANRSVAVDVPLRDGDVLDLCGGIEVIHTPGHTFGHICLLLPDGTLVAGDGLNVADGKLTGANPEHTYDMDTARESVRKLSGYDIKKVVCFHGGLFDGDVEGAVAEILGR